jgi:hypothetical protein
MRSPFKTLVLSLAMTAVGAAPLAAADSKIPVEGEQLNYSWKLLGAFGWIAGLKFPNSGRGELRTYAEPGNQSVNSRLFITGADRDDGYYLYQSQMARDGQRTLVSYHGYSFGDKQRKEQTFFDYVKRLARIHKETTGSPAEYRVKKIPDDSMQDILTGIFFLRQNAASITTTLRSDIYSDGKIYPVVFRPLGMGTIERHRVTIPVQRFLITAAPGSQDRWPGGVKVFLSPDSRHIPLRLELQKSLATLRLDLTSAEGTSVAAR